MCAAIPKGSLRKAMTLVVLAVDGPEAKVEEECKSGAGRQGGSLAVSFESRGESWPHFRGPNPAVSRRPPPKPRPVVAVRPQNRDGHRTVGMVVSRYGISHPFCNRLPANKKLEFQGDHRMSLQEAVMPALAASPQTLAPPPTPMSLKIYISGKLYDKDERQDQRL